ncbi:MAG: alpha/beta hydrolase [Synechococcus sp.]|nr:alpha/beta hydrolase [Synechococcus sp.]
MKNFIQLGEYQAAYTVSGQGKPLVLLHGFFGDAWTLNALVDELKDDFQCFNLELLGFGDSAKPKINYLITDQVNFLHTFIQQLGLAQVYLVGYSYGAWVAAAYAIAQGSDEIQCNLSGITLLTPAGIRDDSFAGRYTYLRPLLWDIFLVDWGLAALKPLMAIVGKKEDFAMIKQARTEILRQPAAAALLKARLRPEDAVDTVEKDLHHIKCPSLIIAAENDQHIPLWHCKTYEEKIEHASLFTLVGAGHDCPQTHPQEIATQLKAYFS